MFDSQLVLDGRVDVVNLEEADAVLDSLKSELIGRTVSHPPLDAAASHPHGSWSAFDFGPVFARVCENALVLFAILLFGNEPLVLGSLQVQELRADVPMGRVRRLVSYQNAGGKTEAHECDSSDF